MLLCIVEPAAWARETALPRDATPTSAAPLRLAPRTVRGRAPLLGMSTDDPGAAATVLTGDELRKKHPELAEALATQPGLQVLRTSGIGSPAWLSVRGSSVDQVAVLVDDLPLFAADGAALDLGDLPLVAVERIEVHRGLAPAWLGGQPLGGTLRVLLRHAKGFQAEASAAAGSYGTQQVEGGFSAQGERASGFAGLRWLRTTGNFPYRLDPGTPYDASDDVKKVRENNDLHRIGGAAAFDWQASERWRTTVRWLGAGLQEGVPGAALYPARAARFEQMRHVAALQAEGRDTLAPADRLLLAIHGTARLSEVDDHAGELGLPWRASQQVAVGGASAVWQGRLWGRDDASASGDPVTASEVAAVVRVDGSHAAVDGRDLLRSTDRPTSSRTTMAGSAALPLRAGPWALTPSAGAEWTRQRLLDARQYPFAWTEAAAATAIPWHVALRADWQPHTAWALNASVRRGTRLASLQELFGDTAVVLGNARLAPERAVSVEAGGRWAWSGQVVQAVADVRAHWTQADDLIQLVGLGARQAMYQNVAAASLSGWEATTVLRWNPLTLTGHHAMLTSEDTSGRPAYDGKVLPLRPRTRWGGRLDVHLPAASTALDVTAWASGQWQSGSFVDAANLIALPARTIASAGLHVDVRSIGAFADLRVDNLLDTPWFDLIGYPLPGRTVWLQVGWRATRGDGR